MLGRLLRTTSITELVSLGGNSGSTVEDTLQNEPLYITDDLKTMMFGTRDKCMYEHLGTNKPQHGFRLIIAQELGNMTSRYNYQIVVDSSSGNFHVGSHVPLNELKDYIFGSPIRINDNAASSDKVKVVKSAGFVLFTRVFYGGGTAGLRIAIACCIPEDLLPVLTECWSTVSSCLDYCEQNLLLWMHRNDARFLPKDWKVRNCTEVASVLQCFQHKIMPLLSAYSDSPRLFLYPLDFPDYVQMWTKQVVNWIELKDGSRMKFLPILLAKLRYDFQEILTNSEPARVVILSGNMNVANMLIFILAALLKPRYNGKLRRCATMYDSSRKPKERHNPDLSLDVKTPSSLTETQKGWEIPRTKRNPTFSVTSVSSNETGAHNFIQPSSLKSGTSSIQYLSSSLNSTYGSYGSWFKKVAQSPSSRSNDSSQDGSVTLHGNSSNTSLHQSLIGNSSNLERITPQPSPSILEYDEYPWHSASPAGRESPRIEKRTSTPSTHNNDRKFHSGIFDVDMKRTINRLIDDESLSESFSKLVRKDPSFTVQSPTKKQGSIANVHISLVDLPQFPEEVLRRYTSFIPHYNQYFQLQACQISQDSEAKVIQSMKRDLSSSEYNTTTTLLVSLRSREIRQVTLSKDSDKLIQRTKKIYQNGRIGPVSNDLLEKIRKLDLMLKKLIDTNDSDQRTAIFSEILM